MLIKSVCTDRPGKIISLTQTIDAGIAVQRELHQIGLWYENSKLIHIEIYWASIPIITLPSAAGIFTHGVSIIDRMLGFEKGHIYIPKLVLSQGFWQNRGSLRDIIRHEYGHALSHLYPELIVQSAQFENAFGGHYYDYYASSMDLASYISDYARTMPCEDFAETFMVYVRRKGIIPAALADKQLVKKWNFIRSVCKKVSVQ